MARGKFNKRGGGKRVNAQSADEIEQRNQRLTEFEENRTKRRAEEEEKEKGGDGTDDDDTSAVNDKNSGNKNPTNANENKPKPDGPPVYVTSAEDHKKNLSKLEAVRARRQVAEARRKVEQEAELAQEIERTVKISEADADDDDGKTKKKKSKQKIIPKLSKIEIKKMKPALMKDGKKEKEGKTKKTVFIPNKISLY